MVFYDHQKDYDKALEAILRLEGLLGGDPYLDFMRGVVVAAKGDTPQAKKLLIAAMAQEPTLYQPYDLLVRIATREQDFEYAVSVLKEMKKHGLEMDIEGDAKLADLAKSKQYQEWKRR